MIDLTAFSHGQIISKQWLCEELEPLISDNQSLAVLGSWYNLTGFMLLNRNNKKFKKIVGYDIDPKVKVVADQICNGYLSDFSGPITNTTKDSYNVDFAQYDLIINTSCEHMNQSWYNLVLSKTLVCMQSSDMTPEIGRWEVSNPYPNMDKFKISFPMSRILFEGTKEIAYSEFSYRRFMLIGFK